MYLEASRTDVLKAEAATCSKTASFRNALIGMLQPFLFLFFALKMFIIHLFPLDHRLEKVIKANVLGSLITLYTWNLFLQQWEVIK